MKKSFKVLVALSLLNLFIAGLFAEGYHVCVASYQKLANAQETVRKLENQSVSAFINENKVKGKSYYRVLLVKEFKKIEDARKYRDEVSKYSFGKELKLKDFWVCKGDKKLSPNAPKVAPAKAAPAKVEPAKAAPAVVPAPVPLPLPKPQPKPEPKPEPEPKLDPIPEPAVKNLEVAPDPVVVPVPAPIPIPEPEPEPEPAPIVIPPAEPELIEKPAAEEPKTLDKNEKAVLSEKTPYSVRVRTYKYSQFAENDNNRLKALGFDSYLLNTFDETAFFEFNLHAGAFETQEEAENLIAQFADVGIFNTEISDYREILPKINRYDEILSTETVTFDDGRSDLPGILSSSVEKLIRNFPANKDYQIKDAVLVDYDNYSATADHPEINSPILNYINNGTNVHSAALVNYTDELYQKNVSILLFAADDFTFGFNEDEAVEKLQAGSGSGLFDCSIYEKNGKLYMCGVNHSENVFACLESASFDRGEFVSYIADSFNDSTLGIYPQIRRTLFALPDNSASGNRVFINFIFNKAGEDFALERGNAEWAVPLVGHALSKSYLREDGHFICVGFYDLDYDFNAKKIHEKFKESRNTTEVSESNQPITINSSEGWYFVDSMQKEISFSTKSYVIAIDAASNDDISKDSLADFSKDLKIWDTSAYNDAK